MKCLTITTGIRQYKNNNDKVTVNIMYCQTCVIDSLASIESGTSYNVNLGKDGCTVLNEMVYNSHQ